jgi:hypothetical protein
MPQSGPAPAGSRSIGTHTIFYCEIMIELPAAYFYTPALEKLCPR